MKKSHECFGDYRDNILPEHFLHAPTQALRTETAALSRQIESSVVDYAARKYPERNPKLLIGSEFEVLYFSPVVDPTKHVEIGNPNYGHVHTQKMATIREKAANLSWKGHFALCDPGLGKIGIEYRTIPGGVEEYLESADILREIVVNQSLELGVLPHAYSQHIHLSLEVHDEGETTNLLDEIKKQEFFSRLRRTRDLIKRAKPMVNRPDAFNQIDSPAIPVQLKGKEHGTDGPNRMEVRRLSRHWAADPSLNLALALQALQDEIVPNDRPTFADAGDFTDGVSKMRADPELTGIFGRSLLDDIAGIVVQYPLVSGGQISVGGVKKTEKY